MISHPNVSIEAEDLADPTAPVSEGLLLSSSVEEVLLVDPVTGEEIGDIAASNAADAEMAVRRAREYEESGRWVAMSGDERSSLLERLVGVFESHGEAIAELGTCESGTPAQFSYRTHCEAPLELIQSAAELSTHETSPSTATSIPIIGYHQPLVFALTTVMQALAQGRPSIIVASPLAPLTTIAFMNCLLEADLPKGVVHMVLGSDPVIEAIMANSSPGQIFNTAPGGADVVSTPLVVGSPDLAGKSALEVCREALLGYASVQGRVPGVPYLFVKAEEVDSYQASMLNLLDSLVVGDPWEKSTDVGPFIRPQEARAFDTYVNRLSGLGAHIAVGTEPDAAETFPTPTVVSGISDPSAATNNTLCAPIAAIIQYKDISEVQQFAGRNI